MTQKDLIIEYLKSVNDWIPAYKLRGLNTPLGFLGHQADRRARELASSNVLERRLNEQRCVEYRIAEPIVEKLNPIIAGIDFSKELKILNLI